MERFSRQLVDVAKLPPRILEKWSPAVLGEGFVPFPKKLVRSLARIFDGPAAIQELAVLLAIVDFKRPNLSRLPSPQFLAFLAGLSDAAFESALRRLEEKNYVRVDHGLDGLDISLDGLLQRIESETSNEGTGRER